LDEQLVKEDVAEAEAAGAKATPEAKAAAEVEDIIADAA
jgi:hypothetical protein